VHSFAATLLIKYKRRPSARSPLNAIRVQFLPSPPFIRGEEETGGRPDGGERFYDNRVSFVPTRASPRRRIRPNDAIDAIDDRTRRSNWPFESFRIFLISSLSSSSFLFSSYDNDTIISDLYRAVDRTKREIRKYGMSEICRRLSRFTEGDDFYRK